MSIIMAPGNTSLASTAPPYDAELTPEFRELLDHIAVELAEEYVRLMEAAAKTHSQQAEQERV